MASTSLKAAAKKCRAERAIARAVASEEAISSGGSPAAAKPAAAGPRPKAAPPKPKRAKLVSLTRPPMLQVRPSAKPRENAQESVDSAKAMAREGVRLRSEAAAAERTQDSGGRDPPDRSHARSKSAPAPAELLSGPTTPTADVGNGQEARMAATAPLHSPGRNLLLLKIEANDEADKRALQDALTLEEVQL